ncbi:MAG: OB-fold nucleic acid binding domain-containing protein [Candidatus Pacearchaeota archaeon]
MVQLRQVAYKVRICDLLSGNIIFNGERFSSLEIKDKKVSRVNIICNVIDKYTNPEKNFSSLTVDDGTGQVRIKAFSDSISLLDGLDIGDTIKVIGWLRFFNDELYILPEIAIKIDPKWGYVRKLELAKEYGEFKEETQKKPFEEEINEIIEKEKILDENIEPEKNAKSIILKKIKENPDGIDVEKLIMELNISIDEINDSLKDLIAEGEIYEPRPGHLRSLD